MPRLLPDATCRPMLERHPTSDRDQLMVLGLESSCDDTAAAIVRQGEGQPPVVLSSVVAGQGDLHLPHGGVVPEIAARAHAVRLDHVTEEALAAAGVAMQDLDAVSVTSGPGLIGGLMAGIAFAKGLATGLGKPVLGVNHLAGHALTARLTHWIDFPYLALLVSGGHCQFLAVLGPDSFLRLGGTIDDAPGEAFDKSARLLGLSQPGGPAIEEAAKLGDPDAYRFPRPLAGKQGCNMSFSGLKTALGRTSETLRDGGCLPPQTVADLSAGFQQAVCDVLLEKTAVALQVFTDRIGHRRPFAVCGGVAANRKIRAELQAVCAADDVRFVAPDISYCTDNGAMIAWAAIERMRLAMPEETEIVARPRWPLDTSSKPILGRGKRGPKS